MEIIHHNFIQARNSGVSIRELCERFNISKSTAYNWIKKYSLVKRTKDRTISVHRIYQLERENQTLSAGRIFQGLCRKWGWYVNSCNYAIFLQRAENIKFIAIEYSRNL